MRKIVAIILLALAGCAQLQHGQLQPVVLKSAKEKIYFTSCTGGAEDWGSCYIKARSTCSGDYDVVDRLEKLNNYPIRELTFRCRK